MNIVKINNEDWYRLLIDDVKSINVEGVFESRFVLIETYHQIGKRILDDYEKFKSKKIYGEQIVQCLADSINSNEDENGDKVQKIDKRSLYYAIKFAKKYPCETSELPYVLSENMGKNVSWTKIVRQELTEPKEECKHEELEQVYRCIKCKKIFNESSNLSNLPQKKKN